MEDQEAGHGHEGEEWGFPGVEGAAGGDVRAAAPQLGRSGVPAGSAERADGRAAQVGRPGAGAGTELRAAGGGPACGPRRGRRAEEAPPQQKRPGEADTKPRGEGHADDDDILHGSCKTCEMTALSICQHCRLFTVLLFKKLCMKREIYEFLIMLL